PTAELMAILRELNDEQIHLDATDSGVQVRGQTSRFQLQAEDPALFPDVPGFGERSGYLVKSGALSTMIRRTLFAVASENSRYALHSVLLEFDGPNANLIATDGKRLAKMPAAATPPGAGAPAAPKGMTLIPPKAWTLVQRILADTAPEDDVEIAALDNEALFRTSKVSVWTRLVEGRFPRYQDVIPADPKIKIPLTVGAFLTCVRQAKIVTNEESRGVKFHFADGTLTLESTASDLGSSEVKLPIAYDAEPMQVTFDPQFLIDALRVLEPTEQVSLELTDKRKASLLRTADQYVYVVMPLTGEGR
ncbi:MAG: DNA polymerase III subunit beta, partial [Planctomycetia bacterium]